MKPTARASSLGSESLLVHSRLRLRTRGRPRRRCTVVVYLPFATSRSGRAHGLVPVEKDRVGAPNHAVHIQQIGDAPLYPHGPEQAVTCGLTAHGDHFLDHIQNLLDHEADAAALLR